jgi:hypothetical protein
MRLIDADALYDKNFAKLREGEVLYSFSPSDIDNAPTIDAVPTPQPSSWWSVEERLPETGTYVVCMAKRNPFSGYMPMVAKILKNGWVNPVTGQYICEVTGWMPMPDPPGNHPHPPAATKGKNRENRID